MTEDANQRGAGAPKHPDHFMAEWRLYRGYTVRGLARMLKVSHSKISRIETGDSELNTTFANKISRFFNIPMIALLTINPQGNERQTAELLDVWAQIDVRKREDALNILRALAGKGC